jgi:uncharacterized protein
VQIDAAELLAASDCRVGAGAFGLPALSNQGAFEAYDALLADDRIALRAEEPPRVSNRWREFAARETVSPKLWMDAYLAAFAVAGAYRLVNTDVAFRQFEGLNHLLISIG